MSTESPISLFSFQDEGMHAHFLQLFTAQPKYAVLCAHLPQEQLHQRTGGLTAQDQVTIEELLSTAAAKGDRFAEAGLIGDDQWKAWYGAGYACLQLVANNEFELPVEVSQSA